MNKQQPVDPFTYHVMERIDPKVRATQRKKEGTGKRRKKRKGQVKKCTLKSPPIPLVVAGVMKISMKPVEEDGQELLTLPEVGAYDRL